MDHCVSVLQTGQLDSADPEKFHTHLKDVLKGILKDNIVGMILAVLYIAAHCFWQYERALTGDHMHLHTQKKHTEKNLGRLWLAYTELQGDFTCYNSYLLTLGTLHSQNLVYSGPIYTK